MALLILGIAIWWAAHLFKRLAPDRRNAMQARMGDASKGVFTAVLVLSVVLMVIGYRSAEMQPVYEPPVWGRVVNNLLMYVAILLFGLGSSKSPLRGKLRHPMLIGFALWALLHLLVNGDLASLVLFGGLLLWVPVQIRAINRAEPGWTPFEGGTTAGTVRLAVIALVIYAAITAIHAWLGVWPFAGGMA